METRLNQPKGAGIIGRVIFGISHVCLSGPDLEVLREFYVKCMGLSELGSGPGWVDVEAGGTIVRLLASTGVPRGGQVRIQVGSVSKAVAGLTEGGAKLVLVPTRSPELEMVAEVLDPASNRLTLWRRLSEDEYGFIPDLAKTESWDEAAEKLMQSFLACVPESFRDVARTNAVLEAEYLACDAEVVEIEHVVRAYIRATPRLMRDRVRQPLLDHGFQPDHYQADFEV